MCKHLDRAYDYFSIAQSKIYHRSIDILLDLPSYSETILLRISSHLPKRKYLDHVGDLHKTFIQTAKIQTHRCLIQCKKTAIKLAERWGGFCFACPKPTGCLML